METNIALIRWETKQTVELVNLENQKQFSLNNATPRKRKHTDFYNSSLEKKLAPTEQCPYNRSELQGHCIENKF